MTRLLTPCLAVVALFVISACSRTENANASPVLDAEGNGIDAFVLPEQAVLTAADRTVFEQTEAAADEAEDALEDATASGMLAARQTAAGDAARALGREVASPASPLGVGLANSGDEDVCDVDGFVLFFGINVESAAAWTGVHGLAADEFNGYISSLVPGRLVADTDVVSHGYAGGLVEPHRTTLAAGTAVLVDDLSIPRVRCRSGHPLTAIPS